MVNDFIFKLFIFMNASCLSACTYICLFCACRSLKVTLDSVGGM